MAAVAGQFVYDVSDPVHPRLICRSTTFSLQTSIHLLDSHAISYINLDGTQVIVVRHDLITGAETVIARLPADPRGYPSAWTSDGTLEAYAWGEQVHLWSGGADHLLYTLKPHGPVGFESRWNGPWKLVEFSPDHAYLAISYLFDVVHIFSVSDGRELLATDTGYAQGGTCPDNDRFVFGSATQVMQWTPTGGAKSIRAERWFGTISSRDGRWLAATAVTDSLQPHVNIVPVGGGQPFRTGLGSSPGFVTPTVVWYQEERPSQAYDPTEPDGVYHAFDVTTGTDQVFRFRAGEEPTAKVAADQPPDNWCCAPGDAG